MKTIIPWVLVVLLIGAGFLHHTYNQGKDEQIKKLTEENQQLEPLRAQVEDLKKQAVPADELTRLRQGNEELLSLRNEVGQLRNANKTLTGQVQTAQTQKTQAQQQASELTRVATENAQLRAQSQQFQQIQAQSQVAACINNLRQIDGAKQQWALENQKLPNAVPTAKDIAPYLGNGGTAIACPSGGTYAINSISQAPTCSVPGHVLPGVK